MGGHAVRSKTKLLFGKVKLNTEETIDPSSKNKYLLYGLRSLLYAWSSLIGVAGGV